MKKGLLIILLLFVLMTGCSVKNHSWDNPVPTTPDGYLSNILTEGWQNYSSGNFDAAYAKFDSLMMMSADDYRGYIGRGFTNTEIGAEQTEKFDESDVDFKFALYLLGADELLTTDTTVTFSYVRLRGDSLYYVLKSDKPILYVDGDITLTVFIDTNVYDTTLAVHEYLDTLLQVSVTTREFITSGDGTLFVPDASIDSCRFTGSISTVNIVPADLSPEVGAVLTGLTQLNQVRYLMEEKDKYVKASLEYGELLSSIFTYDFADSLPDYYDKSINRRNAEVILAQDYYYKGDYYNALVRVMQIDTAASIDSTAGDFVKQLQQAIEGLLK